MKTEVENIIEKNLGIVATIAHKYENEIHSYNDLSSIGCIGLINAAKTIDQRGDMSEQSYIKQMIEKEIHNFFKI